MKKILYAFFASPLLASQLMAQEEAATSRDQGFSQTLIMLGIALFFFYFILWRPERKRRKQMEARRNSMKKGDRVTAMGIIGTIHRVEEQTIIAKMYDGSKIEFLKAAISDVQPSDEKGQEVPVEAEKEEEATELVKTT
jgi:preprotein translocase subunit YajC